MSFNITETEFDKNVTPQFNYLPYGFGEFDTTKEDIIIEKIYWFADRRYNRGVIAKRLNVSRSYVDGILNRRNGTKTSN